MMKVKDMMTTEVVSISPGATLKRAAATMVEHKISGLPVVDVDARVVGVISERDLLFKEQGELDGSDWLRWLTDPLAVTDRRKLDAHLVGEAMTSPVQSVGAENSIGYAARLMLGAGVKRLPVVEHGRLVGIVTRGDLMRAFARGDAEIAADVRELFVRHFLVDPIGLQIEVADGEVTLGGVLESEADVEVLSKAVALVPGVVSVRSDLVSPHRVV